MLGPASPEMMGPFMQRTFRDLNDPLQRADAGGHHLPLLHRLRALLRPRGRKEPRGADDRRRPLRPCAPARLAAASPSPSALTIVIVFPLLVVATWAFTEVWRYPAVIPQQFGLRFWNQTLERADVWAALTLSLRLSFVVTLLSAIICLPAAYAFARLEFPGRNILFFSFLAGQAFPKFGLLVAIAAIFLQLGLIGTFWGVVIIQLVGTLMFMIWIPVAAFSAVDRRMEEAARDAGAGPFRVFWSITLPQAGPTIAAAVLLTFVGTFYETEGAWLIGAPGIRTMPVLMISFINNQIVVQYGAVLSVLLWVPSFIALHFRAARHQRRQLRPRVRRLEAAWRFCRFPASPRSSRRSGAAVSDVTLEVGDGELVCLLGPSGSGKSTLLRMVGRVRDADRGHHLHRRRGRDPHAARTAAHRHGVPEPRALDPHERVQERGLRAEAPPPARRRDPGEGRRRCSTLVGLARLRQPPRLPAFGRAAAARGAGPQPRARAEDPPARRTLREPRPAPARAAARRGPRHPAAARGSPRSS